MPVVERATLIVAFQCSSASRKFLNPRQRPRTARQRLFQCSSASRKFLNKDVPASAALLNEFQCSSASRKFLNFKDVPASAALLNEFQCSSASRKFLNRSPKSSRTPDYAVSVLFSEPKIPQSYALISSVAATGVSVLFSEPKIPQSRSRYGWRRRFAGFSALQRAENSSIPTLAPASIHIPDCDDHASSFLSLPGASP